MCKVGGPALKQAMVGEEEEEGPATKAYVKVVLGEMLESKFCVFNYIFR